MAENLDDVLSKGHPLPPLGKLRNLNQEEADRRFNTPYIEIVEYPELTNSLNFIATELNIRRMQYGLPEEDFSSSTVRLIKPSVYDNSEDFRKNNGGAFFDLYTGICFVKFDATHYQSSEMYRKYIQYVITHELVHKSMKGTKNQTGIAEYSFCLDEGIVDLETRDILESRVLPNIFTEPEFTYRKEYFEAMSPIMLEDGIVADLEDLYYVNPSEGGNLYSRPLEIRVVRRIKEIDYKIYEQLRQSAYQGQPAKAKEVIEQLLGKEVADLLGDSQDKPVDKRAVLDKLNNI